MNVTVSAKELRGVVVPPPFKSEVIRALILYALMGVHPDKVITDKEGQCEDVKSAMDAVEAAFFGGDPLVPINAGGSAAVLRFLAPLLLAARGRAFFTGDASLLKRDHSEIAVCTGCKMTVQDGSILFEGVLPHDSEITVSAAASSQFASGFLLAMLQRPDLRLKISGSVSEPYLKLTMDCMERFGARINKEDDETYRAVGALREPPRGYAFQPDMSYAANFLAAEFMRRGAVGHDIMIGGAELASSQADARYPELVLQNEIDISNTPDLFPVLCVSALKKDCITSITGTDRLRGKESDRVETTFEMIASLGGRMEIGDDLVLVQGCGGKLKGGRVYSHNDHRIVMAAAAASVMCFCPVDIIGADAVKKSAPQFFNDFVRLGGKVCEYDR